MKKGKDFKIINVAKVAGTIRKDRSFKFTDKPAYNVVNITVPFLGEFHIFKNSDEEFYLIESGKVKQTKKNFFAQRKVLIASNGQKKLNVRGMFTPGDFITFWYNEKQNVWFLTKSTDEEVQNYSASQVPGMVSKDGNMLYLGAKIIKKLQANENEIVCRLSVKDKCFMDIFSVSKEEAKNIPYLSDITRKFDFPALEESSFTYRTSFNNSHIYLPAAFFDTGKLEKGKTLSFYPMLDRNGYCVDVDPVICEVCGRPIQRRTEVVKMIDVSKKEKEAALIVRNEISSTINGAEAGMFLNSSAQKVFNLFAQAARLMEENKLLIEQLMSSEK